ncbi:dihydrolipoyllysine-residue acetyltransferase [Shewanella surugensis]|uniref:Dihydrolipoamide acetyltransferase component of pyruvate dehydrogenase complex n=1 Tax=Shewanella surugensis TaxID=212020 RepID=A0ABT0L9V4_9GAMM|nr:dihydrolipoyllysine-residue acetyltransferase [Shewanella surugensis]MCL1124477.1 dihydrolipoyllysine-residue acetyltransferase [Shewanella surugensis]
MIKEFILPDIGEGVVECELVEWLVKEGDRVIEDQPIADVMTDKALVQIPAPHAGIIKQLHYAKGDIAKVHAPLYSVEMNENVAAEELDFVEEVSLIEAVSEAPAVATIAAPHMDKPLSSGVSWHIEEFLLPDIGEGIVECELVEWLVEEGETVVEDQAVADVMTDKALVQIPAMKSGRIATLHYRKGQLAKVHAPLFSIEVASETSTDVAADIVEQDAEQDVKQVSTSSESQAVQSVQRQAQGKALASPAVRRMARSLDIDIAKIMGSGKNGRVYKDDISRHQQASVASMTSAENNHQSVPSVQVTADVASVAPVQDRVEPIRGVRAVMAKMMMESVSTIPHFTYCDEFDLTALVALRESMKKKHSTDEVKLTMMPFFMKALSLALKDHPDLNSQVNSDCSEQTFFARHNIGMAVDSAVGLLVPNVKDVQDKSILAIAADITRLTTAARSGRVRPDDLKHGTISISNIGALGGTIATPIINKPEVAIVALGKLQTLPRFNERGEVEARKIMQVSWSGDHRVIDGGTIARFCNLWKHYLEQPQEMLLAMQ